MESRKRNGHRNGSTVKPSFQEPPPVLTAQEVYKNLSETCHAFVASLKKLYPEHERVAADIMEGCANMWKDDIRKARRDSL